MLFVVPFMSDSIDIKEPADVATNDCLKDKETTPHPSGSVNRRVFVGNMHHSTSEGDLIKLFQNVGTVKDVAYLWHKFGPNKGQPKGYAFVEMSSVEETDRAIAVMNNKLFKGRKLYVSYSENEAMLSSGSNRSGQFKMDSAARFGGKRPAPVTQSAGACTANSSGSSADSQNLKKQRKELLTVEEKMKKLQQALNALS